VYVVAVKCCDISPLLTASGSNLFSCGVAGRGDRETVKVKDVQRGKGDNDRKCGGILFK
jgi:hypothetical protein